MRFVAMGKVLLLAGTIASGCTLLTDAGDRQIDPELDKRLEFTFKNMGAHGIQASGRPQTLDVVLTQQLVVAEGAPSKPGLVAHARIALPPAVAGKPYPDERLVLDGVLREGRHRILFYVDEDNDNKIRLASETAMEEHIWVREVPETKVFEHFLTFNAFSKDDYGAGGDATLEVDVPRLMPWQLDCPGVEQTLEVKIVLVGAYEQEVGYFKTYGSNPLPDKSVPLDGIADARNSYRVDTYVNGTLVRGAMLMAPALGDFEVPFAVWYPLPGTLLDEPRCPNK